jgi:acetyl-CoA C-acetyltransferase
VARSCIGSSPCCGNAIVARTVCAPTADRLGAVETAVIVEGARTPIGRFLGSYAELPAVDLGVLAAEEAMRRSGVEPDAIDQSILGHARQAGNGPNTGRQVSVRAGVPIEVSAYNINIACGSGMKALQLGAQQIALGDAEVVLVGGMENMTRVPFILDRMRTGYRIGDATAYDAMYRDGLLDPLCGLIMGETAENLVDRYDISREEQDAFALESQRKAAAGTEARAAELFPVEAPGPKGTITVTADEHPRPDTTLEKLAKLDPVFRDGGSVTAGNSSGITDGAAAMVLMSESRARTEGREPLAKVVGMSWAGVPPEIMGIGPVPATQKVLDRTGLALADLDLIEINEAFAAQVIACERDLKFERDRLNVNGGGISLGHPIGMSGARIVLSLAYAMRARGAALGLATLCISGGQGLAVVLERS